MAIRCYSSHVLIPRGHTGKTTPKVYMLHNSNQVQPSRVTPVGIKSYAVNIKVFEDQSKGIVCYRDRNGELICEGYDEGPRIYQQPTQNVNHHRGWEMPEFLPHRQLQSVKDDHLLVPNGVAVKENL